MSSSMIRNAVKLITPPIFLHAYRNIVGWKSLVERRGLRDGRLYRPLFSPWLEIGSSLPQYKEVRSRSLVSDDRLWVLNSLFDQALSLARGKSGLACFELGVFRGGTAKMFAEKMRDHNRKTGQDGQVSLHLFDTFEGMPETDMVRDYHRAGDFRETSLASVKSFVGEDGDVTFHPGFIPETFAGLEASRLFFVHIDLDIYKSIKDSCEFVYDRLEPGGVIVFDDYGFPSCPGARMAVDEFFQDRPEVPLVLQTGQAIVVKLP